VTVGSDDFVLLFLLASTFRSFSTFDELYIYLRNKSHELNMNVKK
jgi:hypothetical protein